MCFNADVSNGNGLASFSFLSFAFRSKLQFPIKKENFSNFLNYFQRDSNTILLVISLVQLGWSSSLTFIPCELSERISIAYFEVCDAVDELDWYLFPIEMQKLVPIVMVNSQAPIALRCFGSVFCGRDVFKKVCARKYNNLTNICIWQIFLIFSDEQHSVLILHGTSTIQ